MMEKSAVLFIMPFSPFFFITFSLLSFELNSSNGWGRELIVFLSKNVNDWNQVEILSLEMEILQ